MKKKIFLLAIIIFAVNFSLAQKNKGSALEQYSRVKFKVETSGDITYGKNENYSQINVAAILSELSPVYSYNLYAVTFTYIGTSTIYDYVSNGTPQNIIQDPNNENRIHFVCAWSPWGDPHPNFPGRLIKYFFSTNKGTTWTFISDIPSGIRGGFPQITLMPNGNAMISGNIGSGSNETVRWYFDAAPGLGSFTELYPAIYQRFLFPRTVSTSSLTSPNKFISLVSSNDLDSAFWINCIALAPSPGTFGPSNFLNAKPAECYAIARGDDGRIGVVYITNNLLIPADICDVYFVETTNQGTSFSSPIKIFDANISSTGDSLGAFRGISMVYQGNNPKVVFETVKQTSDGYYFPGAPAKIRFWSNSLPGIDPNKSIVIVDTSKVSFLPYISKGLYNDLFASLCRPTIGRCSGYYNSLFVSFMVPSNFVGGINDTCSFMSLWITYLPNSNLYWNIPQKISPETGSFKDWTYPSISISNNYYNAHYYANISVLNDSVPGSYINHPLNGPSNAKYYFSKVDLFYNINPPDPPTVPELYLPVNGATNVLLNPTLDWGAGYADSYNVQVSLSQTFNTVVVDTGLTPSLYTIPVGRLNTNTTYFWRVRSYSSYWGYTSWSVIWSFTTRSTGINTISSEIPNEYKLFQNYPNPFNPSTIIKFQIPKLSSPHANNLSSPHALGGDLVTLKVYDILGKEVATLVNENLNAGYYETEFPGNNLASGIYFYKLETENFSDIKRMILIK